MSKSLKLTKVSDLPRAESIDNLLTLGVDRNNNSVKVPIEMLKGNKGDTGLQGAPGQDGNNLAYKNIYNITQATGVTYTNKTTARNAVPTNLRAIGQIITYKFSTGWVTEQYIGTDVSGWGVEGNWKKVTDPVISPSQIEGNNAQIIGSGAWGDNLIPTLTFTEGKYINASNGSILSLTSFSHTSPIIVQGLPSLKISSVPENGGAFFKQDGSYLSGFGFSSPVRYDVEIAIPANAYSVILNIPIEARTNGSAYIRLANADKIGYSLNWLSVDKSQINSQWRGKRICWLGTSIPYGQGSDVNYPTLVGQKLGATIINTSMPGQALHLSASGGVVGAGSTALSISEYAALGISNPGNRSYENALLGNNADLYVFDCEPNNTNTDLTDWNNFDLFNWKYKDNSSFDSHRKTYLGALLFLLNKLYTEKPTARVMFIGEFGYLTEAEFGSEYRVRTVTQLLAKNMRIPYINLWEKLQYNKFNIPTFITDKVHPTGVVHRQIADILTEHLNGIVSENLTQNTLTQAVTYSGYLPIETNTFEKKFEVSLDSNGNIAGPLAGGVVIYRSELPRNSLIKMKVPSSTNLGLYCNAFIHNATSTTPVLTVNWTTAVIENGYKVITFKTTTDAYFLTMYTKFNYGGSNYDITNSLIIQKLGDGADAIVIGDKVAPITNITNALVYNDNNTPVSTNGATYRQNITFYPTTGKIAGSVGGSNSSYVLWRFLLKANTSYSIKGLSATLGNYIYLHNAVNDAVAEVITLITGDIVNFTTSSTSVYLTLYLSLVYAPENINFNVTNTFQIFENGYIEPKIKIGSEYYAVGNIVNDGSSGGGGTVSSLTVKNVKDYGAKGDGVTDDVAAIQTALDALVDSGGGTLFFPKGVYALNTIQDAHNVKAHLIIKPRGKYLISHSWTQIRILGEVCVDTASTYATHSGGDSTVAPWENGTVLKSLYSGVLQTTAAATPVSVLAAGNLGSDSVNWGLNCNQIVLENFSVQVKSTLGKYPMLSGINMRNAATLRAENVLVYGSIPNVSQTSPTKDGHYSCGFIGPKRYCNPEQYLQGVYVKGAFRYGFIFSEHMKATNLTVWCCDNAFGFAAMDHSIQIGHVNIQNSKYILTALPENTFGHGVGTAYVELQMVNIESNNGQTPVDFNYDTFVNDSGNRLKGLLKYHIVRSNVGADNSYFKKVGGNGLVVSTLF